MNAKKAKIIRKALREQGIELAACKVLARKQHIVTVKNYQGDVFARTTAQTNYLAPDCGRAIYKELKRQMENV